MVEKCLLTASEIANLEVINRDTVAEVISQMDSPSTTRLLVTDQAVVAQWLSILRESSLALEHLEDDTPYKTLQRGSESEAVRRLQVRLRELGYLTASADGYYSPRVEIAVKAYQAAMGLEPTGIADAHMQRMIPDPSLEKQILLDWLASRVQ